METPVPYLGEGLSLLSAVLWALAVIMFRKSGEKVHPLALNTFKSLLAFVLFIPTIWIFGENLFYPAPTSAYIILLFSGVIGIGFGDTLFFNSLNLLGAGLAAIVVCMYSPFIICLSTLFLKESLTMLQIIGVILIIFAVLIATVEKRTKSISRRNLVLGLMCGALASVCMAIGIVIIKPTLARFPLIWLTEVRLIGGVGTLLLILLFHKKGSKMIDSLISTKSWSYTISGSLIGAYLAMLVWLAGMKYTQASVASALNQTNTIFIFIFAGIILKESINVRRALGIIFAFIGSFFVSFG